MQRDQSLHGRDDAAGVEWREGRFEVRPVVMEWQ